MNNKKENKIKEEDGDFTKTMWWKIIWPNGFWGFAGRIITVYVIYYLFDSSFIPYIIVGVLGFLTYKNYKNGNIKKLIEYINKKRSEGKK